MGFAFLNSGVLSVCISRIYRLHQNRPEFLEQKRPEFLEPTIGTAIPGVWRTGGAELPYGKTAIFRCAGTRPASAS